MSKCKLALNAILVLLLLLPFAHAAVSEEQVQSVGGSSLTDAMPNSARQYLDGVSPENADTLSDSVSRVLENMTSDSQSAIRTALGGLLRVAVIVLLASAARGFSAAAGGEANDWIDMAAALGCAAVLLRDFTVCCRSAATRSTRSACFRAHFSRCSPLYLRPAATGDRNGFTGGDYGGV
ncbi:MAG: hypothetical protein ACLTGV_08900 [Butyricicoccus sp.]